MHSRKIGAVHSALVAIGILVATQASAATYIGTINWMEVWTNENVAFTINGATPQCNQPQFILNASDPGTKNRYALLLTLNAQGNTVTVVSSGCGPAEGYSPSVLYTLVDYMYYYERT